MKFLATLVTAAAIAYSVTLLQLPVYYFGLLFSLVTLVTLAVSWDLMGGRLGYLNLGMSAFYGLGAYGCVVFANAYPAYALLGIPVGGLLASSLSPLVGFISLRLKALYFAIATLTLNFMLETVILNVPATGAGMGINFPASATLGLHSLYATGITIMLITIIVYLLASSSKFGLAMAAIKDDEIAAESAGINTTYYKVVTFFVSSFVAGLIGSLYPIYLGYITPDGAFSFLTSLNSTLAPLLGGIGTLSGSIVGSVFMIVLQTELLLTVGGIVYLVIFGLTLAGVVIFLPSGIVGSLRRFLSRYSSRMSPRNG